MKEWAFAIIIAIISTMGMAAMAVYALPSGNLIGYIGAFGTPLGTVLTILLIRDGIAEEQKKRER